MAHETQHANTLPAELGAPAFVDAWKTRALAIGLTFSVIAAGLAVADKSADHVLRAWLLGLMLTFGFSVGGLALLMVQYLSGGKWGLLLRRPLEAMSRTLPLVFVYWVVIALSLKRLYLWASPAMVDDGVKRGLITPDQLETIEHAISFKQPMLNPSAFIWVSVLCFAIWGFYTWRLNVLGLQRDADSPGTAPEWIKRFENISGPGIVIYAITMTAAVIYWVMSLDPTWYSSVYGLLFLVGQAYRVLALSIIVAVSLSKGEPFKTILRQTEQHDLGKFTFAFVMLNIYLAFSQFLIIWSGNLPEEIPWYLDRVHGRLGRDYHSGFHVPLADSVHAAVVARPEAQQEAAGAGVPVDGIRQGVRSVLADRAELQGCGAQPPFQLGDSRICGCAGGDGGLLGCLLLHAFEDAPAGANQRSARSGDSGA